MKLIPFALLFLLYSCGSEPTSEAENTVPKPVRPGNIQFFEVYSFTEIAEVWNLACIQSVKTDTLPNYMEMTMKQLQSRRLEKMVSFAFDSTYYFVKEKDVSRVDSILAISEIKKLFPEDLEFMWSYKSEISKDLLKGRYLYAVKVPKNGLARIDGRYVRSARTELNGKYNKIYIDLSMNIDGTVEWEKMTEDNLNRCIAIAMDHVVLSCPRVNSSIGSGSVGIEGNFSLKEAEELAARINRGRR